MASLINEIEMTKISDRLKVYNQQEIEIFNKIINNLKRIDENYQTANEDFLLYLTRTMPKKFNVIVKNHYYSVQIINKTVNKYVLARNKATRIFTDI